MIIQNNKPLVCLSVVRRGPREETQAPSRGVLLNPDISDRRCPEEDAAHRPQHVHPWRPGAHLAGQDTIQSGELTKCDVVEKFYYFLYFVGPICTCSQFYILPYLKLSFNMIH